MREGYLNHTSTNSGRRDESRLATRLETTVNLVEENHNRTTGREFMHTRVAELPKDHHRRSANDLETPHIECHTKKNREAPTRIDA